MKQYNGLAYTGNHSGAIDAQNVWAAAGAEVAWGVGISIQVRFTNDADIHFTTAGADFTI
ncbi:hypothetical protein [Massilia pseudoviolaceinigra]|uniref:hypothetical protein n=1 Tax=Massilia pseudoviolaceinigra TaxID=3057165 RepID=UPI0027967763|nr:hypothetical protein [Massilia sp. CCM 9206]MDQ1920295.1 hypothetical protein [Massilia sp. CCM 9206]